MARYRMKYKSKVRTRTIKKSYSKSYRRKRYAKKRRRTSNVLDFTKPGLIQRVFKTRSQDMVQVILSTPANPQSAADRSLFLVIPLNFRKDSNSDWDNGGDSLNHWTKKYTEPGIQIPTQILEQYEQCWVNNSQVYLELTWNPKTVVVDIGTGLEEHVQFTPTLLITSAYVDEIVPTTDGLTQRQHLAISTKRHTMLPNTKKYLKLRYTRKRYHGSFDDFKLDLGSGIQPGNCAHNMAAIVHCQMLNGATTLATGDMGLGWLSYKITSRFVTTAFDRR